MHSIAFSIEDQICHPSILLYTDTPIDSNSEQDIKLACEQIVI